MVRDKILSVRVNSKLLERVNEVITDNTTFFEGYTRNYYHSNLPRKYGDRKVSIADILEVSLLEFLNELSQNKK